MQIDAAEVKEGKTSPPKHFTEDTLLSEMETAGADETPNEAERKGLGTPATRAATIEKLVQRGFIERKGDKKTRQLIATDAEPDAPAPRAQEAGMQKASDVDTLMRLLGNPETAGLLKQLVKAMDK